MLKFIFDFLTEPLGLPIEWYWEYIILAIIGALAFLISFAFVGDMYDNGIISGRTSGSLLHWLVRLIIFAVLWAVTYGIIAFVKWVFTYWVIILCVLGGFAVLAAIIGSICICCRLKRCSGEK